MNKIKRYTPEVDHERGNPYAVMAESPVGRYVESDDYERLADICRRLIDADARGVIISSDRKGTWNVMQELKAELGTVPDAGDKHV
jgi:hypothetical protein